LIDWQCGDGIDIGSTQERQTFRLEPARGHHGMTHQLLLPIREHVDATGRDVGKEVNKIVLLMGGSADLNDGSSGIWVQFFRTCRCDND
jgi:hypothetical protein